MLMNIEQGSLVQKHFNKNIMRVLIFYFLFICFNIQSIFTQDTIYETSTFKLKELSLIESSFFDTINALTCANKRPIFSNERKELFSIYIHNHENDTINIFIIRDESIYQTSRDIGFIERGKKMFFVRGDCVPNLFQINKNRTKVFYERKSLGTKHERGVLLLITDNLDGNEEWWFIYFKGDIKLLDQSYIDNRVLKHQR